MQRELRVLCAVAVRRCRRGSKALPPRALWCFSVPRPSNSNGLRTACRACCMTTYRDSSGGSPKQVFTRPTTHTRHVLGPVPGVGVVAKGPWGWGWVRCEDHLPCPTTETSPAARHCCCPCWPQAPNNRGDLKTSLLCAMCYGSGGRFLRPEDLAIQVKSRMPTPRTSSSPSPWEALATNKNQELVTR
jgi:hypothetical protein